MIRKKQILIANFILLFIISFGLFASKPWRPRPVNPPALTQEIVITPTPTFTPTPEPTLTSTPIPTSTLIPTKLPTAKPTPTPLPTQFRVPPEISLGNTSKKQVIFTFDGGAGNQSAQKIIDVAKKHNVKVTFFVSGHWANQNQGYMKEYSNRGHEIFNHTLTHPYLTKLSSEQITTELRKTEEIIFGITGKTSKPYFRPPYGDRNSSVLEAAAKEGYQSIYWSTDALDWKVGITAQEVKNRIYAGQRPGAIYLMHIGDTITGDILDEVFQKIKNDGYTIVPLTKGL